MSKHISTTETAKIIRNELKSAFDGTKFSVRSRSYSGGSSIDVSWENGPTTKMVDAVIGKFAGSSFDGMIDLKSYHDSEYQGETVHFAADHVFTRRELSREWMSEIADMVAEFWGVETPELNAEGNFDYDPIRRPLHDHNYRTIVDYIREASYALTKLDGEWRTDKDSWHTWTRDLVERLGNRNWPLPEDTVTTIVDVAAPRQPGTEYIELGGHAHIRLDTVATGETYVGVLNVDLRNLGDLIAKLQALK